MADPTASTVDFAQLIAIPHDINAGLTSASQSTMLGVLGVPGALSKECSPLTNAKLEALMATRNVGPFSLRGLTPALDALTRVFQAIEAHEPALHAVLTTAGMTCCRAVRGSTTQFSNHSWGTAVDLSIHGVLTPLGSHVVQRGMVVAAPFFAAERFFWGAGFHTRPDGMHFEASNELIAAWRASGKLP